MLRNYIITALRNLLRNKGYAIIANAGLVLGFGAALLVALLVRDELSYEKWIPGYERIYRVTAGTPHEKTSLAGPSDLGPWFELEFPQIEAVTRLFRASVALKLGDKESNEALAWVDPNFFDVFRFPVVAGDLATALARPDGLVLDRTLALKYFGRVDPIGETLTLDRTHAMQITAVITDLPTNTEFRELRAFASGRADFSPAAEQDREPIKVFGQKLWASRTYFRLKAGGDVDAIRRATPDILNRRAAPLPVRKSSDVWALTIIPIAETHLSTGNPDDLRPELGNIYTMLGTGLLIVLAAGINFVNLITARASRRAVEVGVRKAVGANRSHLTAQFMGEAFLSVTLSAATGIALGALLLPWFSAFSLRIMHFYVWRDPAFIVAIFGFVAVTGMIAGAYPSCILSAFPPAVVLKAGIVAGRSAGHARRALVILQVAIMIGLLASTAVFYRQMQFGIREAMRQNSDPILVVNTRCSDAFKDAVAVLPGVSAAACSMQVPQWGIGPGSGANYREKGIGVRYTSIDAGLFELYGLKAVAGRFFTKDRGADRSPTENVWSDPEPIVVNEAAVRGLGFASPQAAIGQIVTWDHIYRNPNTFTPRHGAEIIGVVEDFQIGQVTSEILPAAFYFDPAQYRSLSIKIRGRALPETMEAIKALWNQFGEAHPLQMGFFDQGTQNMYLALTREAQLFGIFSGIAVFISILGLVGLSAFTAERRTKEIGIRKSMGASRSAILRMLIWEFCQPVLLANLLAWPVAYFFMRRWLEGFARHVDLAPWIFLAASALALVIAVATVLGHALLVARAQPVTALRYE